MARKTREEELAEKERENQLRAREIEAMRQSARNNFKAQMTQDDLDRERGEELFKQNHGGLSKFEMRNINTTSGAGKAELARKLRQKELDSIQETQHRREMSTRHHEAEQKRMGMAEQGMRAAEHNAAAQLQTETMRARQAEENHKRKMELDAMKYASEERVAKMTGQSKEAINRQRMQNAIDVQGLKNKGTESKNATEKEIAEIKAKESGKNREQKAAIERQKIFARLAATITKEITGSRKWDGNQWRDEMNKRLLAEGLPGIQEGENFMPVESTPTATKKRFQ